MGHVHVVSGHVREAHYGCGDDERRRLLRDSNRRVIESLPDDGEWPSLPASMFSITGRGAGSPNMAEYRGRVIHFGASHNQLLDSFATWRAKFEALLRRLYWNEAMVMVSTECWGHYVFRWMPSELAVDGFLEDPPRPVSDWTFEAWYLGGSGEMKELSSEDVDRLQRS